VSAGETGDAIAEAEVDIQDAQGGVDEVKDSDACEGKLGPCNCVPGVEHCPCDPGIDTLCCRTDHYFAAFYCDPLNLNGPRWGSFSEDCACHYPNLPDHCKIYNIQKHPGYCGLPPEP
jgi:hypothetical protein